MVDLISTRWRSSLEGRINYTTVSCLKLCQIEASQHRIGHADWWIRSAKHPYVKILFQSVGISYFEQDGRRIELAPGDCLAYDVSCPHTITNPMLTRHEVVIVPKELLRERGFHLEKMSACKISSRAGTGRIAHEFVHAAFERRRPSPTTAARLPVADRPPACRFARQIQLRSMAPKRCIGLMPLSAIWRPYL